MTTDEFVTEVYNEWGEDATNSIVSPDQIVGWGNRAQRKLCMVGNVLLQCAQGPFIAGQETYNLPSQLLKIDAAFLTLASGDPKALRPMDVADRDPREEQGTVSRYWVWGEDVNDVNAYVIGFSKIPAVTTTGPPQVNYWEVFYRKRPDTMARSSPGPMVNPEVMPEFQDAMTDYVLAMIYRRLGRDFYPMFEAQMGLWKEHLVDAKNFINPLTYDYPVSRRDTEGLTVELY